ncbi:MAG: class I SAM-dependent methyltransferase, partial [Acidobacteria bacterium]|nr:class I SAM-dependent methyltransferase [Acidobacteriota bacterium]
MSVQPDRKWEAFAAREPFFAVFTDPKFRSANRTANHEREFFDSGELLVDAIFHTIRKRLASDFAPESVLEYGCGPGRLAIPFARRSGSVTAVDRSPAMLAVARREAAKQNAGNIHFTTAADFDVTSRKFDLVNSYLLFQRLPPYRGLALFRELLGRIGSGGIGVFHFLYRGTASPVVRMTRGIRERTSIVNGITNIARHKPFGEPFIPSHAYDLDEVFRILVESGFENSHVTFEDHEETTSAIVFVQAPASFAPSDHDLEPVSMEPVSDAMIDVRELIARTSIDELNRTAEEYFSSLTEWDHHLAKPFAKPDEAPPILIGVATLLQGL